MMQLRTQITFRGVEHSDAVEKVIRDKSTRLTKFYGHIESCDVAVEARYHSHHRGNLYNIRVKLHIPDKELVVSHNKNGNQAHEDVYVAIRDAFDAARRQLEDYARIRRGAVKKHEERPDTFNLESVDDDS